MTYCLGIMTRHGLVMASDSRTNSGHDQVNVFSKMHTFVTPGERTLLILASGSLSLTQSVITLLRRDFDRRAGLASAATLYDAAREIGKQVRAVSDLDRAALERDDLKFNLHLLLGGQIGSERSSLYLIYPQGNPLRASEDSPYLQIGDAKYGRPILDRGVHYNHTNLEEAAKYALLSLDSTMRSNVTVGPPIDLAVYAEGELDLTRRCRLTAENENFRAIRKQWAQTLREGVRALPSVDFADCPPVASDKPHNRDAA